MSRLHRDAVERINRSLRGRMHGIPAVDYEFIRSGSGLTGSASKAGRYLLDKPSLSDDPLEVSTLQRGTEQYIRTRLGPAVANVARQLAMHYRGQLVNRPILVTFDEKGLERSMPGHRRPEHAYANASAWALPDSAALGMLIVKYDASVVDPNWWHEGFTGALIAHEMRHLVQKTRPTPAQLGALAMSAPRQSSLLTELARLMSPSSTQSGSAVSTIQKDLQALGVPNRLISGLSSDDPHIRLHAGMMTLEYLTGRPMTLDEVTTVTEALLGPNAVPPDPNNPSASSSASLESIAKRASRVIQEIQADHEARRYMDRHLPWEERLFGNMLKRAYLERKGSQAYKRYTGVHSPPEDVQPEKHYLEMLNHMNAWEQHEEAQVLSDTHPFSNQRALFMVDPEEVGGRFPYTRAERAGMYLYARAGQALRRIAGWRLFTPTDEIQNASVGQLIYSMLFAPYEPEEDQLRLRSEPRRTTDDLWRLTDARDYTAPLSEEEQNLTLYLRAMEHEDLDIWEGRRPANMIRTIRENMELLRQRALQSDISERGMAASVAHMMPGFLLRLVELMEHPEDLSYLVDRDAPYYHLIDPGSQLLVADPIVAANLTPSSQRKGPPVRTRLRPRSAARVREFARNMILLISTPLHDRRNMSRYADRVAFLTEQLMQEPLREANLFGVQSKPTIFVGMDPQTSYNAAKQRSHSAFMWVDDRGVLHYKIFLTPQQMIEQVNSDPNAPAQIRQYRIPTSTLQSYPGRPQGQPEFGTETGSLNEGVRRAQSILIRAVRPHLE